MQAHVDTVLLVHLSIFLIAVRQTLGQYADYQAGAVNYPDYNMDSYEYKDYYPEVEYMCYSCTFHLRQGTAAGLEECRDPFIKEGVPEVPCKGQCAKIYHKTSDTEYTVTRICLPNCKDVMDEKGYTQCCTGHLCNSGVASGMSSHLVLILVSSLAAWLL